MKKHISKLIFGLIFLPCMALAFVFSGGLLSAPATVHAAAGESEADPIICTTFDQFKSAMESTDPATAYIQLNSITANLPKLSSLAPAIMQGYATAKTLILKGTSTFSCFPDGSVDELIALSINSTLTIKGNGTLKVNMAQNNAKNAVIYNSGGTVNIENGTIVADCLNAVYGRIVYQDYLTSRLNISGGRLTGKSTNLSFGEVGTLFLRGGTTTITGGNFMFDNYGSGTGKALVFDDLFDGSVIISSGFFRNNIVSEISPYTISGYQAVDNNYLGGVEVLQQMTISSIGITAPVVGATPVTTIQETDQFTGTVAWYKASTPIATSTFAPNTTYNARITLTPKAGYTIDGLAGDFFTVAGAAYVSLNASTDIITAHFPSTGLQVINIAAIGGVTAPVAGATPVTTITATAQYTGSVVWTGALVSGKFGYETVYTATITLTAKEGYTYAGLATNFFTVAGASSVSFNASTGEITATFPETSSESDTTINIAAIEGVTAPVAGETPKTVITETAQYTGVITWNFDPVTFAYGTIYTATITITPKEGYTLAGVSANFFTVEGATSVTNNAGFEGGVITAVFPATATNNYPILSGNDGTWNKGNVNGFEITAEADFGLFSGVKVDGTVLSADNYTAVSGSTKITLKADYLKTLSNGAHIIEITFTDGGTAQTALTVAAANGTTDPTPEPNPNPDNGNGDTPKDNIGLIVGITAGAIILLAGVFAICWFVIRKKKNAAK